MSNVAPAFLAATPDIDIHHPAIALQAGLLRQATLLETAAACFEWVRDHIEHSIDFGRSPLPYSASDTLAQATGLCLAKSHLLVALLRANGIPAGLCYQRLKLGNDSEHFCLHGLVAVWLKDDGWYRCDPRGNSKPGIHCHFTPGNENLAFTTTQVGEQLYNGIWAEPWPELIQPMKERQTIAGYLANPIDITSTALPALHHYSAQ